MKKLVLGIPKLYYNAIGQMSSNYNGSQLFRIAGLNFLLLTGFFHKL